MEWSHDSPTQEGFYWLFSRDEWMDGHPEVVRVMALLGTLYVLWPGEDGDMAVEFIPVDAVWSGPLVHPKVPDMEGEAMDDEWKDRFAGHFVDRQTGIHYYLGTGMHGEIQEVLAWVIDKPLMKNMPRSHEKS